MGMTKATLARAQDRAMTPKRRSPIHPGEVLLEDFIKPLSLTQYRVALDIGVAPLRISQIVHVASVPSQPTRLCGWRATLARPPGSGYGCKPATTWRSLRRR